MLRRWEALRDKKINRDTVRRSAVDLNRVHDALLQTASQNHKSVATAGLHVASRESGKSSGLVIC